MIKEKRFSNNFLKIGFSTIEILITLFIFSIISVSVIILSFGSQGIASNIFIYQESFSRSQKQIELAKAEAFYNFKDLKSRENIDETFKESLDVSYVYDYTKKIESSVSSNNSSFRDFKLSSYISDWQNIIGKNTCFSNLSNLGNYSVISELLLDQNNLSTDIDVLASKAYITLNTTSFPNFLIVDVSEINEPKIFSEVNTGKRLNALHLAGQYAFLVTNSTVNQLQIVDISEDVPIILNEFRLPHPSSTTTASSIFYNNQKVYIGTEKHEGGYEFHVIDISDPESPEYLNSWEAGTKVSDIAVKGNLAFIATPNPTPFRVLDLENSNIEEVYSFDTGGNPNHGGRAVSLNNSLLALGRSVGGIPQPDYHELYIFDIQDGFEFKESLKIGSSIRDLMVRENVLILTSTLGNSNIIQFRSLKEDNFLELLGEIDDLSGKPVSLDCEDNNIFVVTEEPTKLIIIGSQNDQI